MLPTLNVPYPLSQILFDVEKSIEAKLYYPALLVSLTLPEICCSFSLEKDDFVKKKHYVPFVEKYAQEDELGVSGEECYQLRGGVVHRANAVGHRDFSYTNVIFSIPETGFFMHNFVMSTGDKSAKMIQLVRFCNEMNLAVMRWYHEFHKDPKVQATFPDLLRFCPNGLPPFYAGMPVVASGS